MPLKLINRIWRISYNIWLVQWMLYYMRYPSPECYMTFCMMTIYSDTLRWSGITPICDSITDLGLITEFDRIARGFHRTFATGAACQQRTLTPPDTWSCPILGLASVLMLRPISPELVLFPDFWVSNIPWYQCFAYNWFCSTDACKTKINAEIWSRNHTYPQTNIDVMLTFTLHTLLG